MIKVKLREAMDAYSQKTGERLTYANLAEATGLSEATIQSLATRPSYNATLHTVDLLCQALRCSVTDLLEQSAPTERT